MKRKTIVLLAFVTSTLIATGQVPSYIPTNGLVAWYPFNGNANDESSNTHNGTVNGATLATDRFGNSNAAYDFDGTSYISVPDDPAFNWGFGDYTVSAWINKDAASQYQAIIDKNESTAGDYYGWNLGLVGNDVRFIPGTGLNGSWLSNGTIESDFTVSDNSWYFICGVFDGTNSLTSLYINGALYTSTTASYQVNPDNGQDLKFGVHSPSGAPSGPEYFYGRIDDIAIWDYALTAQEITDAYNGTTVGVGHTRKTDEIRFTPNPTNGLTTLDLGAKTDFTLLLYNTTGTLIFSKQLKDRQYYNFELPEICGIYFVQLLQADGQRSTLKVVKE